MTQVSNCSRPRQPNFVVLSEARDMSHLLEHAIGRTG